VPAGLLLLAYFVFAPPIEVPATVASDPSPPRVVLDVAGQDDRICRLRDAVDV
jgi:hypothetical protein